MLNLQQLKKVYCSEQLLLVLLTRIYFSTAVKKDAEDFISEQPIDWEKLRLIINTHGIASFIFHVIDTNNIRVADGFRNSLKDHFGKGKQKSLSQYMQAAKIATDLRETGIIVIPYKGTGFASRYYESMYLRESIDIDFLVSRDDLPAIKNYFEKNGYAPMSPIPEQYTSYYVNYFKDHVYAPGKDNTQNKFTIEIHWRLLDRFAGSFPSYDFFYPHLSTTEVSYVTLPALSPTYDFLATASNHFVKDMFVKFKHIIDIACIFQKEGANLDQQLIFETTKKYGFGKKMNMGLSLVSDLTGLSIPGFKAQDTSAYLSMPLSFPLRLPKLYITSAAFLKTSLKLRDTISDKIKFCCKCMLYAFLPTSHDISNTRLPGYLFPLLVLARPFRLLGNMIYKPIGQK
jgi:hypothetical protein